MSNTPIRIKREGKKIAVIYLSRGTIQKCYFDKIYKYKLYDSGQKIILIARINNEYDKAKHLIWIFWIDTIAYDSDGVIFSIAPYNIPKNPNNVIFHIYSNNTKSCAYCKGRNEKFYIFSPKSIRVFIKKSRMEKALRAKK